jgi:cysteine desulfurase/selenocysteine lyase
MLTRKVRGLPLAYLDNAATALKPRVVIDELVRYYEEVTANVARGVHTTSQEATERYESVRAQVARFLGAESAEEIVFTSGTTASINLIAQSLARPSLLPGDEILVSELEHHSNIVPWQLVAEQTGARIRAIPITDRGDLDIQWLEQANSHRTKIVAICHISNVLGTVVPVTAVAAVAKRLGAVLVVDGAQSAPHLPIDVKALNCDFYVFSVHKAFGPTGLGVMYGRRPLLERMPPWQGGGGMIARVELERSTFAPPPARFEAGTPPIAEVFGLGAALDYLIRMDRAAALAHEDELVKYATEQLEAIPGVTVYGKSAGKVGLIAFNLDGVHPHDVGTALDSVGVAVRAGHHCAQPLMNRLGVTATVRASVAPYNTREEIDALVGGVIEAKRLFGR